MPATKNESSETDVSGKKWTDDEKLAYLVVLCGHEGGLKAKIDNAPKLAGRSDIACRRMIERLEEQFKQEIARMKKSKISNGQTTNKRKNKNGNDEENGSNEGTPKKNKNKSSVGAKLLIKEEIPEEEIPE